MRIVLSKTHAQSCAVGVAPAEYNATELEAANI